MPEFIPEDETAEDEYQDVEVPFFEDASKRKHGIKGKGTTKNLGRLKDEISNAISELGGSVKRIVRGKFEGKEVRHGFLVEFTLKGATGRMPVAGLPIKNEKTERKKKQCLKQALYTVRESLEAQYNMKVLTVDSEPLLQYLLIEGQDGTEGTLAEQFKSGDALPAGDQQ